jgi:putative ABC transport system permease protein
VSADAIHEVARLPGVMMVEPMRVVPVRLRVGHRSRQTAIIGLPSRPRLQRVVDKDTLVPFELPLRGLVMSKLLAEILGVQLGDRVSIEVLEGRRPVRSVAVSALVDEYLGTSTYMEIDALRRVMREGGTLSGATITIDQASLASLYRRLKDTPTVAGVNLKWTAVENFKRTIAQNFNLMISFNVGFSIIIAFGVIYNAARVSLSERSRELASLRVMGFTRAEVSAILMGELATVTAIAVPVGLALGYVLAYLVALGFDNELYRIPLLVTFRTYVLAVFTVWIAAMLSGLVIKRKLGKLDLIGVLKTRE